MAEDASLPEAAGAEIPVSGDSPTVDAWDCRPLGISAFCLLGVADLRPELLYDRHRSLVRSRTSLAMASKAAEYLSLLVLDSATINSAKSSNRSWSFWAAISLSTKFRCRSIEACANASNRMGRGVVADLSSVSESGD